MKKEALSIVSIAIIVLLTMAFLTACSGNNDGIGYDGVYYSYENGEYQKLSWIEIAGKTWSNDEGLSGTITVTDSSISLTMDVDGNIEEFISGTIKDGVLYLDGSYFCKEGSTPDLDTEDLSEPETPDDQTVKYTVSLYANGGRFPDGSDSKYLEIDAGGTVTVPVAPTNEGHTLVGWATDRQGRNGFDLSTRINSALLLYAVWEEDTTQAERDTTQVDVSSFEFALRNNQTYQIVSYSGNNAEVIIPNTYKGKTVASIDWNAFHSCTSLTSITIPDSVTSIGECAFEDCDSLTSVYYTGDIASWGGITFGSYYANPLIYAHNLYINNELVTDLVIPNGVTEIKDYAFKGATCLTSVTIPDSVTSIGGCAFNDCTSLTSITIPDGVTSIGEGAFGGCSSLTNITIPDSVTSIGNSAFSGCTSLTSVTIPDSVTSIGNYAFLGCTSLTSITIPDSVTSIGNAFYNCPIETATIPVYACSAVNNSALRTVTLTGRGSIGNYAFSSCSSLTSVTIGSGVTSIGIYAFSSCSSLTSITIPDSVTSIGNIAFKNCTSLASITIPDSVTSIGECAFEDCDSLTSVYYTGDIASWGGITFDSWSSNPLYYAHNLYIGNVLVTDLVIPNGVTEIKEVAFAGGLFASVTIPDSVTSIGDGAFYNCPIETATIPVYACSAVNNSALRTVTLTGRGSIGNFAFSGCTSLTSVTIPDSVTSIGNYAFRSCTSLASVTIPDSVTSIGEEAFRSCTSLTSVTIPDSVTSIGGGAFSGCTSLTSIMIPDSVTSIRDDAFYNCPIETATIPVYACSAVNNSALRTVTITGRGSIRDYAFEDCTSLTSITIPDSVTSIGDYAFSYCTSLTSITIPDSVTSIGSYAFSNCASLTSITIGSGVTSIRDDAFYKCTNLQYNEYDNAYYLGNESNPYIALIKARSKYITSCSIHINTKTIAHSAFWYCRDFVSVTIPSSVMSISGGAFLDCDALKNVYYLGDIASWCRISFAEYSSNPLYYAHKLYINDELVTNLIIPNDVTNIESIAFESCTSIESITIPNSVTSIGFSAFYECTSLTSVYYTGDIASWCGIMFDNYYANPLSYAHNLYINNELVTDLVIPNGETGIKDYAFSGATCLTSVTIPDSVTSIGEKAFSGCTSLTNVTIPDSVTSIGSDAFYKCTNLQYNEYDNAYYLGNEINPYVVLIKTKDTSIVSCAIHEKTKIICVRAFYGCTSLASVTIGGSVTSIGERAFSDCTSLTSVTIPDSVTSIGGGAFSGCTSLTSVTISDSVTSIGSDAFYKCPIETATIPVYACSAVNNSALRTVTLTGRGSIRDYAFEDCTSLTSITIPDSVTSIGHFAFRGCTSLTSIVFNGTKAQWNAISKGSSWNYNTGDYTIRCTDGYISKY